MLHVIAVMLDYRRFDFIEPFLQNGFYSEGMLRWNAQAGLQTFAAFSFDVPTLEQINRNSSQRYHSLHGKLLADRCKHSGIAFEKVVQADLCLYLRAKTARKTGDGEGTWYMVTYPYMNQNWRPLEIFARAESAAFFGKLSVILGTSSVGLLKEVASNASQGRWQHEFSVEMAIGSDRIATKP